jgi:2-methylthioadenine synthetase
MMTGYTPDNKTIHFPGDSSMIDSMVRVRVLETKTFSIFGEIVYE